MKRIKRSFKIVCCCLVFSLTTLTAISQNTNDFKTIAVDKRVKDFPEEYSKATPIDAFISISNITANGKMSMKRAYSSYSIYQSFSKQRTPDREIPEELKNKILNWEIKECIIYRDSTAAVISTMDDANSFYLIIYFSKENGEWLLAKEDGVGEFVDAQNKAINHLPMLASYIPMMEVLKQTPKDTVNFTKYIKTHGKQPKNYVLEKLAKHKLVIYGEMHRRTASWDLLRQIIADPKFVETTGTIFMEFGAYNQEELDRFYAQEELDKSILLNIFGRQQLAGWTDKGQFDFIIALRELNKKLPNNKKIKVIFADEQLAWPSIKTAEEFQSQSKKSKDRNTQMADIIQQTIQSSKDSRNSLFIVGFGHGYKSHIPGTYSTPPGQIPALSAGAQLVERFSDNDIFSIFPHCPSVGNKGEMGGRIRNGLYDYVFEMNGNTPIAFDLKNSPFGKEPFDGMIPMKFDPRAGSYSNNYDGYIFFGKLEDEENSTPLLELFTDDFVNELKRRATITGMVNLYDVPIKDLNKEHIINLLKKHGTGKLWNFDE
ncbi:erythromycin esterase family protein [Dysgonomonas sp. ZJ279]|uniref:erythromycin esterase family protein n=1 Tax=Dysgonomonas sp. ZJ279 TaxID=2709796 RepID=UPI0013E9A5F0|nr:erythromycin esterase family protein [Dysgonomonas sp. ZJ279]